MIAIATTVLSAGVDFLRKNPMFPIHAARNATRLEMTVPLDLVRWGIARRPGGKGPERIDVNAVPPGINVGLTVDLYGTKLDVSAQVVVERVEAAAEHLRLALRVSDLSLSAPPGTPAAMMLGSFDLSRPAALLNMMPMKHGALLEAQDDLIVIDLLKIKGIAKNPLVRRILAISEGAAHIREIRTENDALVIGFGVNPLEVPNALLRLRGL